MSYPDKPSAKRWTGGDRRAGTDPAGGDAPVPSAARAPSTAWAGYAAAAWAFVFAAVSVYWAAGGTAGVNTLGGDIGALAANPPPGFVALLWAIAVLKVLGGLLALALVQPWGRALSRRLLRAVAGAGGVGLLLYGVIPGVVNGLMLAGVLHLSASAHWTAAEWTTLRWHVLLWDPWWALGGILFVAAARSDGRRDR